MLPSRLGKISDTSAPDLSPGTATQQVDSAGSIGLTLYLLFIISWFLQLGRRVPALGAVRLDLLLVAAISVFCLTRRNVQPTTETGRWTSRRFVFLLVGYALVTLPFVEWPGSVLKSGFPEFFKAVVFCLFTVTLVRDARGLRKLMLVFVGCQAFRVLEPLYLHVTDGYWGSYATMANWEFMSRLAGAPYDIVNPNGLAFVIVTSLVFCHFLCPLSRIGTVLYLAYLPLAIWALMLTASRTGMMALAIVVGSIWWKSRRKILIAAIVGVTVFVVLPLLSPDLTDRYRSMFSSDAKNSGTVSERTVGLRSDIRVAMRRPLFGHGLGTSGEANANFGIDNQPAHNLYVEIAEDMGFVGLVIFLGFMMALGAELRSVRARCRETNATGLVARTADALHVFLMMNLTFSLASYGLSGYEWYMMAGLSGVLAHLSIDLPVAQQAPANPAQRTIVPALRLPPGGTPLPAGVSRHALPRLGSRIRPGRG